MHSKQKAHIQQNCQNMIRIAQCEFVGSRKDVLEGVTTASQLSELAHLAVLHGGPGEVRHHRIDMCIDSVCRHSRSRPTYVHVILSHVLGAASTSIQGVAQHARKFHNQPSYPRTDKTKFNSHEQLIHQPPRNTTGCPTCDHVAHNSDSPTIDNPYHAKLLTTPPSNNILKSSLFECM